jgi:hypothetical protein
VLRKYIIIYSNNMQGQDLPKLAPHSWTVFIGRSGNKKVITEKTSPPLRNSE